MNIDDLLDLIDGAPSGAAVAVITQTGRVRRFQIGSDRQVAEVDPAAENDAA